jgi:hypothetical protein
MRGQGLNDLPRCELEPRSSHHKGIFFEVPFKFIIKPCLLTFGRALLATAFLVRFSGLCRRGHNVLP